MAVSYPAIKGTQFRGNFYLVKIPYGDLGFVTAINPDIQRRLNKRRVKEIAQYICSADGWLPAVTLAAAGPLNYKKGILSWNGPLWVIDGQHRIEGIKLALQTAAGASLTDHELAACVFPNLQEHRQSQLFADMNGKMVPVSKALRLARDFRDRSVLITRDVVNNLRWNDKVEFLSGQVKRDTHWAFTWLVEANRQLLQSLENTDEENAIRILTEFWGEVGKALGPYLGNKEYLCSSATVAFLIGYVGKRIINEEDFPALVARLGTINWSRNGGDFEGSLVVNGVWKRGASVANINADAVNVLLKTLGLPLQEPSAEPPEAAD